MFFLSEKTLAFVSNANAALEYGLRLTTHIKDTSLLPPLRAEDRRERRRSAEQAQSVKVALESFAHSKLSRPSLSLLSSSLSPLRPHPPGFGAALLRPVGAALQARLGERLADLRERQAERGKPRRRRRRVFSSPVLDEERKHHHLCSSHPLRSSISLSLRNSPPPATRSRSSAPRSSSATPPWSAPARRPTPPRQTSAPSTACSSTGRPRPTTQAGGSPRRWTS